MNCFYCSIDVTDSKKIYHIAPQAAGNSFKYLWPLDELTLPVGLRCDECNQYFGEKVEPGIINHPYVLQWRAVYGVRAKKGWPVYAGEGVEIRSSRSGLLDLRGEGIQLTDEGHIQVSSPSLDAVDHLQLSRAVHKIALEYELLQFAKRSSIEEAREKAGRPPLSIIANYVRRGGAYRPYGVEPQGAHRVSIAPIKFEPDPKGVIISPPAFTGYIVCLPGARFSCTLAEDPSLLAYMLERVEKIEYVGFLTTKQVFWALKSGGVSKL